MSIGNPYNYDPLRVVDPGHYQYRVGAFANPTPQLGQVKQDAGWDYAANPLPLSDHPATQPGGVGSGFNPNAKPGDPGWRGSVDYTAAGLANAQGGATGAWNVPGWAYGGNQLGGGTYDQATGQWHAGAPLAAGSDVYGAKLPVGYNAAGDRGHMELNGQNVETFWSKFLRFSRDYNQGGIAPEQAMHLALSRLRDDNGGTLAGTGFDDIPDATAQAWHSAIQNTGNPQGASPVSAPTLGSGLVQGATVAGDPNPPPAVAAGNIPSVNNQAILQSPDEMLRIVLQRMGINQPLSGPFASFFKQRLMQLVDSAAHVALLNGVKGAPIDNLQNVLGGLASSAQGNHFMSDIGGIAGQGLSALESNPLIQNAPYAQQDELLQRINALNEAGMSPYAASGLENMYQQGTNDYMAKARQKPAYEMGTGAFPKFLGGTALGQYYGLKP